MADQPSGRPPFFGTGETDAEGELVEDALDARCEAEELAATGELEATGELLATAELVETEELAGTAELAVTGADVVATGRVAGWLLGLELELGPLVR